MRLDMAAGLARRRQGRRATLAVELLFALPVLLILVVGMIEFSMVLSVRFQLLTASQQGARVAAQGGSDDEVKTTVKNALGTGRVADAEVFIDRSAEDPQNPQNGRARVQVCVVVNAGHVVPDLLVWAGIGFRNINLTGCTVMNLE